MPVKSACTFCTASKPAEIDALEKPLLRRIVAMEARAAPRLGTVEGLWRKAVKGHRGAIPHPGSMTEYIRERGLLPADEVDAIAAAMPVAVAPPGPMGGPGGDEEREGGLGRGAGRAAVAGDGAAGHAGAVRGDARRWRMIRCGLQPGRVVVGDRP